MPTDLIPRVIDAARMGPRLRGGVRQTGPGSLEAFLADVYGPGRAFGRTA